MVVSIPSVGPRREHLSSSTRPPPPALILRFLQTDFSHVSARVLSASSRFVGIVSELSDGHSFFARCSRSFVPSAAAPHLTAHCRRGHADFGVPRSAPLGRTAASVSPPRAHDQKRPCRRRRWSRRSSGPGALGRFSSNLKVRSLKRSSRALGRSQTLAAFGDSFRPIATSPPDASPSPPRRVSPAGGTDPEQGGRPRLDPDPAHARPHPPPPARLRPRDRHSLLLFPLPTSSTPAT